MEHNYIQLYSISYILKHPEDHHIAPFAAYTTLGKLYLCLADRWRLARWEEFQSPGSKTGDRTTAPAGRLETERERCVDPLLLCWPITFFFFFLAFY